jgi:hypothetical protein
MAIRLHTSNIYCVWYPSGGFGHFVNAVLTLHGKNFKRPKQEYYEFGKNGNSHNLDLVAPKFFKNPTSYNFNFETDKNYCVLVDNGIDDESESFLNFFPGSKTIKICYNDHTWPIVAKTSINKAMNCEFNKEVYVDPQSWPDNNSWAQREKYFLYLRDHHYRKAWQQRSTQDLELGTLLKYQSLVDFFDGAGIATDPFETFYQQWYANNISYISPVLIAQMIILSIKQKQNLNFICYQDLWLQAVINYYLWLEFDFEVPANDYSDWFTNTNDIVTMLNKHGVKIDSN